MTPSASLIAPSALSWATSGTPRSPRRRTPPAGARGRRRRPRARRCACLRGLGGLLGLVARAVERLGGLGRGDLGGLEPLLGPASAARTGSTSAAFASTADSASSTSCCVTVPPGPSGPGSAAHAAGTASAAAQHSANPTATRRARIQRPLHLRDRLLPRAGLVRTVRHTTHMDPSRHLRRTNPNRRANRGLVNPKRPDFSDSSACRLDKLHRCNSRSDGVSPAGPAPRRWSSSGGSGGRHVRTSGRWRGRRCRS